MKKKKKIDHGLTDSSPHDRRCSMLFHTALLLEDGDALIEDVEDLFFSITNVEKDAMEKYSVRLVKNARKKKR